MNGQVMELLICAIVAASVAMLVYCLYSLRRPQATAELLPEGESVDVDSAPVKLLLPYARLLGAPFARRAARIEEAGAFGGYGGIFLALRNRIRRSIGAAGNPGGMSPDTFIGLVILSTILWFIVGLGLGLAGGRWVVALTTASTVLGAMMPINWLRGMARRRTHEITKALPYALDLLTLAVGAGLDFTEAMTRLAKKLVGNPLGAEFAMTVRSIQLGRGRTDALRDLAVRVGTVEMSSVAGAIIQADELGASLAPILRIQAEQMRFQRFQSAEERAMKAPVKIIFPLALCILPTTLMILFGALAVPHMSKLSPILGAKLQIGF